MAFRWLRKLREALGRKTPQARTISSALKNEEMQKDIADISVFLRMMENRIKAFFSTFSAAMTVRQDVRLSEVLEQHGFKPRSWAKKLKLSDVEAQAVAKYRESKLGEIIDAADELEKTLSHLTEKPDRMHEIKEKDKKLSEIIEHLTKSFEDKTRKNLTELHDVLLRYPELVKQDTVEKNFSGFFAELGKDFSAIRMLTSKIAELEKR
jgi:hypothetical protein